MKRGDVRMTPGERIKKRRLELNMSVEELAEAIGKSRATVYRYENGFIDDIPISILKAISEVLQTTPTYLMDISDEPNQGKKNQVVSTDPWDPDDMAYAEKDDNIRIMGRGYKRLSPENRALLLQIAKKMFAEDFDEEGNKRT